MQFRELAEYFKQIDETNLRNQKTAILAELFKKLTGEEVAIVSYLSVGRVGPLFDPLEFGLAGKMVVRAVAWGTGKKIEEIAQFYKTKGDLGGVVADLKPELNAQISGMSITEVFRDLREVAMDSGKGSQERKIERLGKLLKACDKTSAKYIVRLVMGKLRLGFSDLTILDSLSWARTGGKADREAIERAYNVWSDMGEVARVYKDNGLTGLAKLDVVPGRPVKPMRAERLGTIAEISEKLEKFAVEPKYDGMRVQVHAYELSTNGAVGGMTSKQVGMFEEEENRVQVKVFSRGLEDITHMFPDIVEGARKLHERVGDFVIDGEALGIDQKTGTFLAFQETMKRKRKHDIGETAHEIPLSVQVFDVLYHKGKGTLQETYETRRKILDTIFLTQDSKIFVEAESHVVTAEKEAQALFDRYMKLQLEGMLCKRTDSHYQAGARNFNWVKYKRAHEEGLVDTIDAVVMGYYAGRGKRQKFGVGSFLVGVAEGEKILTVAKIGTGLTDEQFEELYKRMQKVKSKIKNGQYEVAKALIPDVWVEPKVVVEIQADEITKSPIHSALYALRFPRLTKFRDDKQVSDITTAAEVKQMCNLTASR